MITNFGWLMRSPGDQTQKAPALMWSSNHNPQCSHVKAPTKQCEAPSADSPHPHQTPVVSTRGGRAERGMVAEWGRGANEMCPAAGRVTTVCLCRLHSLKEKHKATHACSVLRNEQGSLPWEPDSSLRGAGLAPYLSVNMSDGVLVCGHAELCRVYIMAPLCQFSRSPCIRSTILLLWRLERRSFVPVLLLWRLERRSFVPRLSNKTWR